MNKQRFYFLWLSAICIVIFVLQSISLGFTELFKLSEQASIMPWQFVTAIFLHGSLMHLMYNLLALVIFGLLLEQLIGSKRFIILFFTGGIMANLISFFWFPNALGASGAIYALLGALAILRPMMSVWAFGLIIPMFIAAILWIGGSLLGLLGFGSQTIGHLAHLSGIAIGLLYGIYLRITAKGKHTIYQRQIKIPEHTMRTWENRYMG